MITEIEDLKEVCNKLSNIIFNNEFLFLDKFCRGRPEDLLEVNYNHSGVTFTHLNCYGAIVKDNISWSQFKVWLKEEGL